MSLRITRADLQTIIDHAQSTYPQECCGVLVGKHVQALTGDPAIAQNQVLQVHPVANAWHSGCLPQISGTPESNESADGLRSIHDRYWIDPADLLHIMKTSRRTGLEIIGIYHSHPDHPAIPSEIDRQYAWSIYQYLILHVEHGQVTSHRCWQINPQKQFCEVDITISGTND